MAGCWCGPDGEAVAARYGMMPVLELDEDDEWTGQVPDDAENRGRHERVGRGYRLKVTSPTSRRQATGRCGHGAVRRIVAGRPGAATGEPRLRGDRKILNVRHGKPRWTRSVDSTTPPPWPRSTGRFGRVRSFR